MYFLASFPKSGNTWVRFLIANIYNQIFPKYKDIDFFNIHEIVPALPKINLSTFKPSFEQLPLVIKTHDLYNKDLFDNVILILRNPWDVLFSYYHYLKYNNNEDIDLHQTIYSNVYGIEKIVEHTDSFIRNCRNVIILTYEKLHHEPLSELLKLTDFLNINIDEKILKNSINLSNFDKMRKTEIEKGKLIGNKNFIFVRSGKINEGYEEISKKPELNHFIINTLKKSPILYLLYS
jgi:hypothetical protein